LKSFIKYFLLLFLLEFIVVIAGFFIISTSDIGIHFRELLILSGIFTFLSALILIIFFRGQGKEPASQTLHSLVSIVLKFLAELILVFIWFFIAKKRGLSSVILFFVIYLTFTLFSVLVIRKTLKSKSL
jgi:hypothetical protein